MTGQEGVQRLVIQACLVALVCACAARPPDIEEIIVTAQRRVDPVKAEAKPVGAEAIPEPDQPQDGHGGNEHRSRGRRPHPHPVMNPDPASAFRAPAGSAASAPAEAPTALAETNPTYRYRLTSSHLERGRTEFLSVGIARLIENVAALDGVLAEHQAATLRPLTGTAAATGGAPSAITAGGQLDYREWRQFHFIRATIHCEDVLECSEDAAPRSIERDPLIWDFPVHAVKWDETRTTAIRVEFYGDQAAGGSFATLIDAIPPLELEVEVSKDLDFWARLLKSLSELAESAKSLLAALGALVTLVLGWFGWKRRASKAAEG